MEGGGQIEEEDDAGVREIGAKKVKWTVSRLAVGRMREKIVRVLERFDENR